MVYRAIGLMSGSSLDGLDIVFAEFHENGGKWQFEIKNTACYPYSETWKNKLSGSTGLPALEYLLLDRAYGHYLGQEVNRFIEEHELQFQVALIVSHGHTSFHQPPQMTAQLGDGSAIAAETGLPVISDLRSMDVSFGGQGAPIVPIGELLLMKDYDFFLNLGGIANISVNRDPYIAFDICPANRVLNLLASDLGKPFDKDGAMAAAGRLNPVLLEKLNALEYYERPFPKSLSNNFGTDIIYPLIREEHLSTEDALNTYAVHIGHQVRKAVIKSLSTGDAAKPSPASLLVTGGGAFNTFLIQQLTTLLTDLGITVVKPPDELINFKEALIMAFIGVLRWREEYTVIPSVTGATRASIGGALWNGQEA
ncbi:MAG: anhydro-N-acetylmuramic acid kinase [Terrimonas sp.]|nr:anhydro-N-acetylmuramic acid kinase [Terrimonas sp.]